MISEKNPGGHYFALRDYFHWAFQISHYCVTENVAAGKIFGKTFWKAIIDTIFPNMWSVIRGGIRELDFLLGAISKKRGKFKLLEL